MTGTGSAIGYAAIQAALSPLTGLGYLLLAGKATLFSRRARISATAVAPLYVRFVFHEMGTREDPAVAALLHALPSVSPLGLRLALGPTRVASRLTGHLPRMARYPLHEGTGVLSLMPVRTAFFDEALGARLPEVDQVVLLGAGFDTRPYGLLRDRDVRAFEVDRAPTQEVKRATLRAAGIVADGVTYVTVDFNRESWLDALVAAGFDPDRPTFFLWEGVTYYLEEEAVRGTLRTVAERCAPGSAIAFDYYSHALLQDRSLPMRLLNAGLGVLREDMVFAIDTAPPARDHVEAFVASCGLTLQAFRPYTEEGRRRLPMGGLALAVREVSAG